MPPKTRRMLLNSSRAPGRGRLLFAAFWRGLLISIVITGLIHAALLSNQLDRIDRLLSPPLFLVFLLGSTAAFHYWIMHRYRKGLQASIREASQGQRAPFCLSCGHDLTGTLSATCPECGHAVGIADVQ